MFKNKLWSLAVICSFVLSACQGGSKPVTTILRVGWASEPDTINPLTTYSTEANEIIQLVYDKLLGYDVDLKVKPELAKEYAYSGDGKTSHFQTARQRQMA